MREALEHGVWGVVATPFTGSTQDVDTDSLATLVEHYESVGAVGLTVLGVFGEAAALSADERALVLDTVTEASDLPLVVGVTALATRPVVEEIRAARSVAGDRIRAFMVQANSADPGVVTDHLQAVHRVTGARIVLQDYPAASGVAVSAASVATVVRRCEFVAAVKAESPPTSVAVAELTAAVDVPVFGGLGGQGLLDELAAGAAGAMTGFSYPEALVACVRAWQHGGYEAARDVLQPFLPLVNFEQQAKIALAVRKELLLQRGLIRDAAVRAPAVGFPEVLRDSLRSHLSEASQACETLTAGRI
ncbi:dihydrodipicolinate synthase family protein [Rhodococcus sp. NPDC056960]|uniref:dihydrodipicolinate synthase family protein n=1 Tax=Rhodococcus sp. NPDC056960 TaxID=3345982 RepID=UPI0036362074